MDAETRDRARRGVKPDLRGWDAIAAELGVTRKTARRWESESVDTDEPMPIVSDGPKHVGAYADRLRAWATTRPMRRAA